MGLYVGLDVSLESLSICIVDDACSIVWEARVAGEPEAVLPRSGSQVVFWKPGCPSCASRPAMLRLRCPP